MWLAALSFLNSLHRTLCDNIRRAMNESSFPQDRDRTHEQAVKSLLSHSNDRLPPPDPACLVAATALARSTDPRFIQLVDRQSNFKHNREWRITTSGTRNEWNESINNNLTTEQSWVPFFSGVFLALITCQIEQ